jgi:putative transposase
MSHYRRSLAKGATFFFTVNLEDRKSRLLVDEIDRLRNAYRRVAERYPFETIAICVLPDHLHAIWQMPVDDADFGKRWALIKRGVSAGLSANDNRTASKIAKREKGIWQRRFWEHQIRDDLDLQRHVYYTYFNPVRHGYVKQVSDWPHSSFHRDVRNGFLAHDWSYGGNEGGVGFGE